ncbi:hypothetical protein [Brachybacterium sp.]|uniref:hypothetical protein n=1 Tax=Brachybacterium sp. TaxID=1891286 RepID=UPI002ED493BA
MSADSTPDAPLADVGPVQTLPRSVEMLRSDEGDPILTIGEVSQIRVPGHLPAFGSEPTIRDHIARGVVPTERLGGRGVGIRRSDLWRLHIPGRLVPASMQEYVAPRQSSQDTREIADVTAQVIRSWPTMDDLHRAALRDLLAS